MCATSNNQLEISVEEGPNNEGSRTITGYVLEVPAAIPITPINGRTDGFQGSAIRLSWDQATALYEELGRSLEFIRPLIKSGAVKILKNEDNSADNT